MKRKLTLAVAALALAAGAAHARPVALDVSLSSPYVVAGQGGTIYLRIGLTGAQVDRGNRAAGNIAIVLDRSGSMDGEKIERAKEAALLAVDMLDPRDIVSVVTYSDTVHVLVPATRASDRERIRGMIARIRAEGSTALFAGVSKGADEVRKFLDRNRVNRVILLSDGLANVGPDTPGALADLGASLKKQGISVTTIGLGLGYNEDLMVRLARESDGNHAFVESSRDLARIFERELGDILSVVAREVRVEIRCADGVRPVRVVGREADIVGQLAIASINELYGNQEKYLLLELEVPAGRAGETRDVAVVNVAYADTGTESTDRVHASASVSYTASQRVVEENTDRRVMSSIVIQRATEDNDRAVQLRDEGRVEEARELLLRNARTLRESASKLDAPELEAYGAANEADARALEKDDWEAQRKKMRSLQHANQTQQSY
jgi:Ca-activated chloride channel family protein